MALYRLWITEQPTAFETETGLLSIQKIVSEPILEMRADHITPVLNHSRIFKVIIDRDYWRHTDLVVPEDSLIWFTDGSRMLSGTGSGIFGVRPSGSLSFPLGKFAIVFQTEIYAMLQCAYENIRRAYRNKRILIFSDSQAALRALDGSKVTSNLVAECLNALSVLAGWNEVTLAWVPGHCSIPGNEEADRLARQASGLPLHGPELALGIPTCSVTEAIRAWTTKQHLCTWRNLTGHRHAKLFISGPCGQRADNLLKLSRRQLKMVVAILTGHAPVRKHLHIMGLFNGDPTSRFCGKETETVQHIICCCEALARQRYNVFGSLEVVPTDICTASVGDLCLLIRGTRLQILS
jgi:ribonuclease HI